MSLFASVLLKFFFVILSSVGVEGVHCFCCLCLIYLLYGLSRLVEQRR